MPYIRFRAAGLGIASAMMAALAGCRYGPVHTSAEFGNAVAQPGSHVFALASKWQRQRDPEGFLATFPDGGSAKVVAVEARIYVVDVERRVIVRVARFPDFGGIPRPSSVHIEGWQGGDLYVRLFGYGRSSRRGDDISDAQRLHFRVSSGGGVAPVERLPAGVKREAESGPSGDPAFLRLSRSGTTIDIGIDGQPYRSPKRARIIIDPETGEPKFDVLP